MVTVPFAFAVVSGVAVGSVANGADSDGDAVTNATDTVGCTYVQIFATPGGELFSRWHSRQYESTLGTDPNDANSDGDGIDDGVETMRPDGTGPGEAVDTDGTPDYPDDADEDGPDGDIDSHGIAAIDETTKVSIMCEGSY